MWNKFFKNGILWILEGFKSNEMLCGRVNVKNKLLI